MKRIINIFTVLSLLSLPCFATVSITTICKSKAYSLDCNNNKIMCTDGFVDGMTTEKAISQLCNKNKQEVTTERDRKNTIKISAINDFCKLQSNNYTFTDECTQNKVTFGCKEYKIRDTVRIKNSLKNYCNASKTNEVIIKDSTTEKKAVQKAEQERQKKLCTSTNGEWKSNRCVCNNKNDIFDDERGCIAGTPAFVDAQQYLNNLYSELQEKLQEIEQRQTQ